MTRAVWSKVFGVLAGAVLLLGTGMFIAGIWTTPEESGDLYGFVIAINIVFVAIPTMLLTSLLGGISLILSRPERGAGTVMFRAALVTVAAVSMSAAVYEVATNQVGPEQPFLFAFSVGALYLLWRNVRKAPKAPNSAP